MSIHNAYVDLDIKKDKVKLAVHPIDFVRDLFMGMMRPQAVEIKDDKGIKREVDLFDLHKPYY